MELMPTLLLIAASASLTGFAIWRDSKPRQNGKAHWFSWKPVLMVSTVVLIVFIAHLLNLYGIETGRGQGRP